MAKWVIRPQIESLLLVLRFNSDGSDSSRFLETKHQLLNSFSIGRGGRWRLDVVRWACRPETVPYWSLELGVFGFCMGDGGV